MSSDSLLPFRIHLVVLWFEVEVKVEVEVEVKVKVKVEVEVKVKVIKVGCKGVCISP